eukprot:3924211-Pyramimonas_sp.AAC.1
MKKDQHYEYWAHGGISHRRREDAMLVQQCGSARLRRAGVAHIARYHDASNAFYCVHKDVVERAVSELAQEGKEDFFLQRIYTSTFVFADGRTSAHMAHGSGVLPGDHAATKLFVITCGYGVESMTSFLDQGPWQRALHMTMPDAIQSPRDQRTVDRATSTFVDDV